MGVLINILPPLGSHPVASSPVGATMSRNIKNALHTIIITNVLLFFLTKALLILANGPLASEIHIPDLAVREDAEVIDWSRFAYSQHVTDTVYLCNLFMIFEAFDVFITFPAGHK
jgi:hypothetical protein